MFPCAGCRTADETRLEIDDFAYTVSKPGRLESASIVVTEIHRRFILKMVDWPPTQRDTVQGRGALDFDRVQWPLVLRNWRPGDSYRPHGSRRVRKLKRLLLKSRVPRSARGSWPVLTSEGKVIWASGHPVAEEFAPHRGRRIGLVIGEEEVLKRDRGRLAGVGLAFFAGYVCGNDRITLALGMHLMVKGHWNPERLAH